MQSKNIFAVWVTLFSFVSVCVAEDATATPQWKNPVVDEGKVVILPETSFQPQAESKTVFDVSQQKSEQEIAKGLERVARWVNLNAGAGVDPKSIAITVVLHGDATKAVLTHEIYRKKTKAKNNPNLKLIGELAALGVEFYVCGQALAHHGYALSDVTTEVKPATAALSVLVQRQGKGYAILAY